MSVICSKCNTINLDKAKFCKNCGSNIIAEVLKEKYEKKNIDQREEVKNKTQLTETNKSSFLWIVWSVVTNLIQSIFNFFIYILIWVISFIIIGSIIFTTTNNQKEDTTGVITVETQVQTKIEDWYRMHTAFELPKTKIMYKQFNGGNAPLQIYTEAKSGENYFIKVDELITGKTVLKLFIRSGEFIETNLLAGTYIIKYSTGINWYGEKDLFGPKTSYFKAGDTFTFDEYNGYTIELIKQINGNLQTQPIDSTSF